MKKTYQLLIHGHGFNVAIDDASGKIRGFFTARRIKASSHDEALRLGLEHF
ncbi:MAG: hypothetical protein JNJ83_08785 [Verrucomicrobiaceae bacterium]|nr:hypothetical protein [Verrucomicrobiaceae bacterium]